TPSGAGFRRPVRSVAQGGGSARIIRRPRGDVKQKWNQNVAHVASGENEPTRSGGTDFALPSSGNARDRPGGGTLMVTATPSATRVFLVEDNFLTRETMSLILGVGGSQVVTASNGRDAIERLRSHEPPSLILLDLNMPVMDGMAFCQQ